MQEFIAPNFGLCARTCVYDFVVFDSHIPIPDFLYEFDKLKCKRSFVSHWLPGGLFRAAFEICMQKKVGNICPLFLEGTRANFHLRRFQELLRYTTGMLVFCCILTHAPLNWSTWGRQFLPANRSLSWLVLTGLSLCSHQSTFYRPECCFPVHRTWDENILRYFWTFTVLPGRSQQAPVCVWSALRFERSWRWQRCMTAWRMRWFCSGRGRPFTLCTKRNLCHNKRRATIII